MCLSMALADLPKLNRMMLKEVCEFLFEVGSHSEENLMTFDNLARVWSPNILRSENENPLTWLGGVNKISNF